MKTREDRHTGSVTYMLDREMKKKINLILFFMVDLCQCAVGNKRSVDLAFSLDTYCVCVGVHGSIRSKIQATDDY